MANAARAWNAGPGFVQRGARWEFHPVTLPVGQTAGRNNGRSEVYSRDDFSMWLNGCGGALACAHVWDNDADVVYNTKYDWCITAAPSHPDCRGGQGPGSPPEQFSLGHVMVHEFGHVVGLAHELDVIATMNPYYMSGGDIGEHRWLINEDDSVGLKAMKPASNTGFNLAASRFKQSTAAPGVVGSRVIWENDAWGYMVWDLGLDNWLVGTQGTSRYKIPENALLIYHGTGSTSFRVDWRLSTNSICSNFDYLVGQRFPSMSANVPYSAGPNSWDLSGVPPGDYYMCVLVDPYNAHNETLETDNKVHSTYASIHVQL